MTAEQKAPDRVTLYEHTAHTGTVLADRRIQLPITENEYDYLAATPSRECADEMLEMLKRVRDFYLKMNRKPPGKLNDLIRIAGGEHE